MSIAQRDVYTSVWHEWDMNLLCRQCGKLICFDSVMRLMAGYQPVMTPEDPDQPQICDGCFDEPCFPDGMEGIDVL